MWEEKQGSHLAYATSDSPTEPYQYRGYIVDNGVDYPGGNDHGSIACINGQWYIFYQRMTMTSLGFQDALNPYEITPAEIACVLKGGALVTEKNVFERVITEIRENCVIGYNTTILEKRLVAYM